MSADFTSKGRFAAVSLFCLAAGIVIAGDALGQTGNQAQSGSKIGSAAGTGDQTGGLPPLPRLPDETPDDASAYRDAMKEFLSMTPDEIRDFRKRVDERQKAAAEPPRKAPEARTRSIDVGLKPGEAMPRIAVQAGYASTLSIFDLTGSPWPIAKFINGNEKDISIEAPMENGHFLVIRPRQPYSSGNLVVFLKDVKVPLIVDLASNGDQLDGSLKMRVTLMGPDAKAVGMQTSPEGIGSPALTGFLQGIPPQDAEPIRIDGVDATGWAWKGRYYIRTRAVVLSPAPTDQSHDADLGIYEIPQVSMVLVADGTRRVEARVYQDGDAIDPDHRSGQRGDNHLNRGSVQQ